MRPSLFESLPKSTIILDKKNRKDPAEHCNIIAELLKLPFWTDQTFLKKTATVQNAKGAKVSVSARGVMALAYVCTNKTDGVSANLADFAEILLALNRKHANTEVKDHIIASACGALTTDHVISLILLLMQDEKIFHPEGGPGFCRGSEFYTRVVGQFIDKMGEPFLEKLMNSIVELPNVKNITDFYTEDQLSELAKMISEKKQADAKNEAVVNEIENFRMNFVYPMKNCILQLEKDVPPALKTLLFESRMFLETRAREIRENIKKQIWVKIEKKMPINKEKEELHSNIADNIETAKREGAIQAKIEEIIQDDTGEFANDIKKINAIPEQLLGLFLLKLAMQAFTRLTLDEDQRLNPLQKHALKLATPMLQKMATSGDSELNDFVLKIAVETEHPKYLPSDKNSGGQHSPLLHLVDPDENINGVIPILDPDTARTMLNTQNSEKDVPKEVETIVEIPKSSFGETPRDDSEAPLVSPRQENTRNYAFKTWEKIVYPIGGAAGVALPVCVNSDNLINWWDVPRTNFWVAMGPMFTSGIASIPVAILTLCVVIRFILFCKAPKSEDAPPPSHDYDKIRMFGPGTDYESDKVPQGADESEASEIPGNTLE